MNADEHTIGCDAQEYDSELGQSAQWEAATAVKCPLCASKLTLRRCAANQHNGVACVTRAEPVRNRNDPKIAALERRHSNEMGNTQIFFRRSGADFNN